MSPWTWSLAAVALAGEHDDAPAPAALGPRGVVIPAGDPVTRRLDPTESVQAAVDAAPAGSVLTLAPGTWAEHVVVDRPLVLRGEPGATLEGGGTGTVLTVVADDVRIEHLRVTCGGDRRYQDDAGVVVDGKRVRL
jgi:nitrous oxidase accessory protein NosD